MCPAETFPSPDAWAAVTSDDAAGRTVAAAEALQQLLDAHGTALMTMRDGGLLSLRQATATLPEPTRAALGAPYESRFGPTAREGLARVASRPDHSPADLYAIAERFPLSSAARDARAAAARRALAQGDRGAATSLGDRPGPPSPFAPLPFDAPWLAKLNRFGSPRDVPVGSPSAAFLADRERGVLAFAGDGLPLWRYAPPSSSSAAAAAYHPGDTGRGPLSVPAVLADDAGGPQLVVVRQGFGLTALRAADGRLFWSTEGDPDWAGVAVLGSPAVSGRCVVAVAMSTTETAHLLEAIALDVTSGRPLWRCPLGPVPDPSTNPGGLLRRREPEPFHDAVPPTFAGTLVIVPDNAGAVVAIDRFGGDVRWARPYPSAVMTGLMVRHFNDGRNLGRGTLPPLPSPALLRWSGAAVVAGDVVWVAPQDAVAAYGLDRMTGRVLWKSTALPDDATCVGVAGGRFIIGGVAVTAVDAATGVAAWSFSPAADATLTGPPAIRDDRIFVRTSDGLVELAATDGTPRPAPASTPDFQAIAASDAGRAALIGAAMEP